MCWAESATKICMKIRTNYDFVKLQSSGMQFTIMWRSPKHTLHYYEGGAEIEYA